MTDQQQGDEEALARDRREQRAMWIFSAVIVLIIVGGMGANMLFHKSQPTASDSTEMSSQSRTAPSDEK
jgi:flagellar basal body-associated protein FliL